MLMALCAMLPLGVLHAYTLWRDYQRADDAAYKTVLAQSIERAVVVQKLFDRSEALLRFLVSRPEVTDADPANCQRLLDRLSTVDEQYANIVVVDAQGSLRCASLRDTKTTPPHAFRALEWFRRLEKSRSFVFQGPLDSVLMRKQISVLALPLVDDKSALLGAVALALDMERVGARLGEGIDSRSQLVGLLDSRGTLLTRFPDAKSWIGRSVPPDALRKRRNAPEGVIVTRTGDGIERVVASTDVRRYDLRVTVGTSAQSVFAPVQSDVRRSAGIAVLLVLFTLVLAYLTARWFRSPVDHLLVAVRGQSSGEASRLGEEGWPSEYRSVVQEFNKLSDSRDASERILKLAARKAERLAAFNASLLAVNRAITSSRSPLELYEELCLICASTQHASLAWVGEVDADAVTAVASEGPARSFASNLSLPLDVATNGSSEVSVAAVRSGAPALVDDYLADERMGPWHDRARAFELRGAGAFPLKCNDQVVSVLCVYFREPGILDRELVALLEQMAFDVSHALDNFLREAQVRRTRSALQEQGEQLAGLLDAASDAILTVDGDFAIQSANRAAAAMLRFGPDDALGQSLSSVLPDVDPEKLPAATIVRASRRDGQAFPAAVSLSFSGPADRRLGLVVMRDLTALHEAQASQDARVKAEAANQAKTQFISRMSHELRKPLNAVLGFTQLLHASAEPRLTEVERRQLDNVFLAGAQLRALIDDVLDVSRLDAGTLSLSLQPAALPALLDEVLEMSEKLALKHGVQLLRRYDRKAALVVRTDALRLRQVMLNLVSNAIKYNRADGVVNLSYREASGAVELKVTDNGLGMTPQQLTRAFQPFERLGREFSRLEGTGMGMPICRQLVELLGGALSIDSEPGVGTLVTVRLPHVVSEEQLDIALPSNPAPLAALAASPRRGQALAPPAGGSVLYVEDDPMNALLVSQLLSRWPTVSCEVAPTGTEGLAAARASRPSLVLLDMNLPDMSGVELLGKLRAEPDTRDLHVVALSASVLTQDIAAANAAGAAEYWTKPIDFDSFLAGVHRILESKAAA